jgi:hypothetical protein
MTAFPRQSYQSPYSITVFCRLSVANLMLGAHPSCEVFVQTSASNWNRLIDELRRTDGRRVNAVWIDLEVGQWRNLAETFTS